MRIAYLVLAHHLPGQLARLVGHLKTSGDVYIHIDRKAVDPFLGLEGCHLLEDRRSIWWGGWTYAWAQLALARAALPGRYDYYCLLSGQCYPIKPLETFARFLEANAPAEHIHYVNMATHWPQGAVRFEKHYFEQRTLLKRALNRLLLKIPYRRVLPKGVTAYTGWQWWALSHDCLSYVVRTFDTWPEIGSAFRYARNTCETAFQTVIGNSDFGCRVNLAPIHELEFPPGSPNPRVWTTADLPRLLASKAFFARKFDERVDSAVLSRLDSAIDQPVMNETRST